MPGRQILIADPDLETARQLAPALRQRGHAVAVVQNGSRALELCVLRAPDLVLFDLLCPLLEANTFRQILRANPRTEAVPVMFMGRSEDQAPLSSADNFLLKPFNVDEILARIDQVFRRDDAQKAARRTDRAMDGVLGQLSLVDLLQVLGQARKSGELRVTGPRGSASVRLRDGIVASAQAENARGPKAFFRLLAWRDGTFSFTPGEMHGEDPNDIEKPVEELLLEGLRQSDELGSVRDQLPDPATRLELEPGTEQLLSDQPAIAAEILELASGGATIGEILERAHATDFVVAHTLLDLFQRKILSVAPGDLSVRQSPRPLLAPGAAHSLRVSLLHGRQSGSRPRGKILLSAVEPGVLATFLTRLAPVPGCGIALDQLQAAGSQFGSVGRIDLGEDLSLDLVQLPADEPSRPLWLPFSSRAIGAIALASPNGGSPRSLMTFVARTLGLPIVLSGPAIVPKDALDIGPQLTTTSEGPAEAVRLLLVRASQRSRTT